MKRREEDKHPLTRLWNRFTPLIQTWGWLSIIVPVVMLVCVLVPKAQAFDMRLGTLERQYAVINGKLDTVIFLMRRK